MRTYYPRPGMSVSAKALCWSMAILAAGVVLIAATHADAHDIHVRKAKPLPQTELPYCGTSTGFAVSEDGAACYFSNHEEYPTPRFTTHGWSCPSQYHLSGRPNALRCDEET